MHLPRLAHNVSATVALFRESLPLGVMSAMIFLYVRFDSMVVYRMMGSTALAFYAICFRIVEPALMVPNAFSITLLSVLSASGNNVKVPSQGVLRTTLYTLWPAYIFITGTAVVLIFAGRPLLVFFNSQYIESLPVLGILTVLLFVRTINVTLTALINSTGRYSALARIAVSNLVVNVVLVLILVRTFGVVGAAWAAFGTEFWNMCAQWGCLLRLNRVGDLSVVGEVAEGTACE
jgi:O-antigen/teichoic acid export membrane protein